MTSGELACRQVAGLVLDYVEDGLDAALRRRVDAHLRRCAPCANEVGSYAATVWLVVRCFADPTEHEAPLAEGLVASVLAARRRAGS